MLDITVRLNPYGDVEKGRSLARIRIANVTSFFAGAMDDYYVYYIQESPSPFCKEGINIWGLISEYNRMEPAIYILSEVMDRYRNNYHELIQADLHRKIARIWNEDSVI